MIAAFAAAPVARPVAAGVTITRIERGAQRIDVLAVSPSRRLVVLTGHDRTPGLQRTSAMAVRHDAVAGVNGGYFATGAPDTGDPTGVVVSDGEVLSEPVGARTALVIPEAGRPRIASVRWRARVTAGGASRKLDGVNRNRGRIPACGGVGGDQPTQRIDTARTCTDPSELVLLTPAFGARTRTTGGVEAVVEDGAVSAVRRAGDTPIPGDGTVLSGTGDAARFLRRLAPGDPVEVEGGIDGDVVLGGAPRLVRDNRVDVTAAAEGRGSDTGRAPRTIAGVKADGTVLLIVVWGRGATLREAARTARGLGARDALCLDSGGSTTMTVGSRVLNRPTDPAGERAVADGLFVLHTGAR